MHVLGNLRDRERNVRSPENTTEPLPVFDTSVNEIEKKLKTEFDTYSSLNGILVLKVLTKYKPSAEP